MRHRPSERLSTWLSYSLSQSRRTYRPGTPEVPHSYHQTHVATVTASYSPSPKWELGAKWHYATGAPYTPVVRAELVTDPETGSTEYAPIYGDANSARVAPFHRLDVRVARTFSLQGWRLQAYLEVLNTYARRNVLGVGYSEDYAQRDDVYQLPTVPFIGLRADF